jgi:BirA family biotin operon repressor/biotin-[acetyl-CoA-carboxylase] ligase
MGRSSTEASPRPAYPVIERECVVSTNDEALALARRGESGPLWVVAERQTGGRGRNGRGWEGATGNLFASLLLPVAAPAERLPQLALVAGVGTLDAIASLAGTGRPPGLRLKWPNDILVGTAKLGGILVESSRSAGQATMAVIGIGLNVAVAPTIAGRRTTSLAAEGVTVERERLIEELSRALGGWLDRWSEGRGFAEVRTAWLARAGAPGEPIMVDTAAGRLTGHYRGIDEDGALLLAEAGGRVVRVSHGDVDLGGPDEFC